MKSLRLLLPLAVFRRPRRVPVASGCRAIRARCRRRSSASPRPRSQLAQSARSRTSGCPPRTCKGQVWLLNVWASWCVSCRVEHPLLVELAKANVVPVIGLNYKDKTDEGKRMARAARRSVQAVGRRRRRPRRHRLGRLRRSRDLRRSTSSGIIRYKQIGPITVEALQQKILPLVRELQKAMTARCLRNRGSRDVGALMLVATLALAQAPDPALDARLKKLEEELRCLVCQNQTLADSERAARRGSAPRGARAGGRGQERRGDQGVPGRALRRLRPLRPAGQAHDVAAVVRAVRAARRGRRHLVAIIRRRPWPGPQRR